MKLPPYNISEVSRETKVAFFKSLDMCLESMVHVLLGSNALKVTSRPSW